MDIYDEGILNCCIGHSWPVFVKLVVARRKFTKHWKQEEEYALQISRKVYEPLSLSERYAFILF